MGLHIVVAVKRTPTSTSVAIDSGSGQVKTDGLPHGINPLDEYAVEEALRIKEKVADSKVTVLSMGPPEAADAIRSALALGCQGGVLVCDPAFTGSDTLGTSYLMSLAVKKLAEEQGAVHLMLFGKQTSDGESGHTTAEVAAWLGWPSATSVRKIPEISDAEVTVERMMEDGADTLKLKLPAVIGVTKEINEPRLPSLKGKMAAKKAPLAKWGAAELKGDGALFGGANAPTEWGKLAPIPSRTSGTVIDGETPEDKAKNLVGKLKETKFI